MGELGKKATVLKKELSRYPTPLAAGAELDSFPAPAEDLDQQEKEQATAAIALHRLGYLKITRATAMLMDRSPNRRHYSAIFALSNELGSHADMLAVRELWKTLRSVQNSFNSALNQLQGAAPAWNLDLAVNKDFGKSDEVWRYKGSRVFSGSKMRGPYKIAGRVKVHHGNARRYLQVVDPRPPWSGHIAEANIRLQDDSGDFFRPPSLAKKFRQCNPDGSPKSRRRVTSDDPTGH